MPMLLPFLPAIIGGVGSVVGGALANKGKSTTTPSLSPEYQPLQSTVLAQIIKRLQGSTDLSGYQAGGTQNINHTFDLLKQSQDNNLTSRGLSTSPVAATVDATRENARGGQVAQFGNSIPLLQRELQGQDLGLAANFLNFGRGSTTTGSEGGGAAGAFTNLAGYIGYLQGKKAFPKWGTQQPVGTPPYVGDASGYANGWG